MGILDRILLFTGSLICVVLALAALALYGNYLTVDMVWSNFTYWLAKADFAVGAVIVLAAALRLLKTSVSSKSKPGRRQEFLVLETAMGTVEISAAAIRGLVDKTVCSVREVRAAIVEININGETGGSSVVVKVRMSVLREVNIPQLADQVRENVETMLTNMLGLADIVVNVVVDDIDHAHSKRQRVV